MLIAEIMSRYEEVWERRRHQDQEVILSAKYAALKGIL